MKVKSERLVVNTGVLLQLLGEIQNAEEMERTRLSKYGVSALVYVPALILPSQIPDTQFLVDSYLRFLLVV
jgi:hypothetical protein